MPIIDSEDVIARLEAVRAEYQEYARAAYDRLEWEYASQIAHIAGLFIERLRLQAQYNIFGDQIPGLRTRIGSLNHQIDTCVYNNAEIRAEMGPEQGLQ